MNLKSFFDKDTYTMTYVVSDPESRDAIVIDPVLDFDPLRWRTSRTSVDALVSYIRGANLRVRYILDTHAHADHLSGMEAVREIFEAPTAIGKNITVVQKAFAKMFNLPSIATDGRQWSTLLDDNDVLDAGSIRIRALHTPGHTPACMSYLVGDRVFTGDALFMPDYGTGRCDFPNGSATDLYTSVTQKLYTLPDSTRVLVGHDYLPGGRELQYETTIGESKKNNFRLPADKLQEDFVREREARDAELAPPHLILQSLQVNIDAGRLPTPEADGERYLKMPLNRLGRRS